MGDFNSSGMRKVFLKNKGNKTRTNLRKTPPNPLILRFYCIFGPLQNPKIKEDSHA